MSTFKPVVLANILVFAGLIAHHAIFDRRPMTFGMAALVVGGVIFTNFAARLAATIIVRAIPD